uniref:Uncharacterized protein n=1 Tax=Leptobrachium leishanense TaxID=445787 RepID=A0A8C5PZ77_9ANUR
MMASADLRDELTCSICLSIYTDPVTLTCGHSFCRTCIEEVLDTQERSGVYTCPECRAELEERPSLEKNRKLSNIAESFQSSHPEKEEVLVFCTYCIQSPVPAAKTCLLCEASMCENHLRVHSKSEEHILTEPTTSLSSRKCSVHKKVLEYYCSEDAACICVSCSLAGEHRGHQVETVNAASEKKKVNLRKRLEKLTLDRQEAENQIQSLQEHRKEVQGKAVEVTERVIALFKLFMEQLEALEKQVLNEISRQEEQASRQVSDLIRELEIKKEELSRKMGHIEELCKMTDPLNILQGKEPDIDDGCDNEKGHPKGQGCNKEMVIAPDDIDAFLISMTIHKGLVDIVSMEPILNTLGAYVKLPDVRETTDVSLDENTASPGVRLSPDLKSASFPVPTPTRPEGPERFWGWQVLSTSAFSSGQHFWVFKVSNSGNWMVGMAYPTIDRKTFSSLLGMNDKSWGLGSWKYDPYIVRHGREKRLPHYPSHQTIGMYLDYEAGRLSFYELCDSIKHLHTFTATFTEPLHVGLGVFDTLMGLGKITHIKIVQKKCRQLYS